MSELTDFLLARIAEDEEWAAVASHEREPEHVPCPSCRSRAEAECAAKRRIVEAHAPSDENPSYTSPLGPTPTCTICVKFHADMDCENEHWPCPTLRALANIYVGADGWREEWA